MPATVSFRLNKPKNKDGSLKTLPVSVLVYYYNRGVEVELSSGIKIEPGNFTGSRVIKEVPRAAKINKLLSDIENKLLNIEYDHRGVSKQEEEVIARQIISGKEIGTTEKKTLVSLLLLFIAQYKLEKDPKTVARYEALLNKITEFNPSITVNALDLNFYDRFKKFLYSYPNPLYTDKHLEYNPVLQCYVVMPGAEKGKEIGLFDEIVFKYFVLLKTVLAWGEERGHIPHPSYKLEPKRGGWQIIKREYPPITYTKEELYSIEGLNVPGHLQLAQDVISLESRVGQRISDIKKINPEEIKESVWTLTQKKGNRLKQNILSIPLEGFSAPALLILQKYNFRLPIVNESQLNRDIRMVAMLAKVDQDFYIERWAGSKKIRITGKKYEFISTHTGKKSFITILADLGVPVKIISELTGTSIRTIERHYLGNSSTATKSDYLKKAVGEQSIMRKAQ